MAMASGLSSRVPNTADAGNPATRGSTPEETRRRGVPGANLPGASIDTTPVAKTIENRLHVAPSALDVVMFLLQLDRRAFQPAAVRGQVASHPVEGVDQRPELVARFGLHPVIEPAGADLVGRRGQHLHRPGDPLGQIESHPRRPDQNHQREHQEEHPGRPPESAA